MYVKSMSAGERGGGNSNQPPEVVGRHVSPHKGSQLRAVGSGSVTWEQGTTGGNGTANRLINWSDMKGRAADTVSLSDRYYYVAYSL